MNWLSTRRRRLATYALLLALVALLLSMCGIYLANRQFYPNGFSDFWLDLKMLKRLDISHNFRKDGKWEVRYITLLEKLYLYTFTNGLNGMLMELRHIPFEAWHHIADIQFLSLDKTIPVKFSYRNCSGGLRVTYLYTHIDTTYDLKSKAVAEDNFDIWTAFNFHMFNYYNGSKYVGYGCKVEYKDIRHRDVPEEVFIPEIFSSSELRDPELDRVPAAEKGRDYFVIQNWR